MCVYCGKKIPNTKCAILTIFRYTVQGCEVHSHCATIITIHLQNFFLSFQTRTPHALNNNGLLPQPLATTILLCELDFCSYLTLVESCIICPLVTGLFISHNLQSPSMSEHVSEFPSIFNVN